MCLGLPSAVSAADAATDQKSPFRHSDVQAADEYLKDVLTEAAKDVHSQEIPDVTATLRQGGLLAP